MKFLGVNTTGGVMWLACVRDGEVVETVPPSLTLPGGMESGKQLVGLLDDSKRILRQLEPEAVLILEPEANNRLNYAQSQGRVVGETLLSLAAAQLDVPCDRLNRAAVRAALELPKLGSLASHVPSVIPAPVGRAWSKKRDLAALAALAGERGWDAAGGGAA